TSSETSASISARRTSRSAACTSASLSAPRPVMPEKILPRRSDRLSNISRSLVRIRDKANMGHNGPNTKRTRGRNALADVDRMPLGQPGDSLSIFPDRRSRRLIGAGGKGVNCAMNRGNGGNHLAFAPYRLGNTHTDPQSRYTMTAPLPYLKLNGLGNDFVVLDARATPIALSTDQVRAISHREAGVGCDQLIVMERDPLVGVDVFMRIYNAEGGEVDACGNATRAIAGLVAGETGTDAVTIRTNAGILLARIDGELVTADMGAPRFA